VLYHDLCPALYLDFIRCYLDLCPALYHKVVRSRSFRIMTFSYGLILPVFFQNHRTKSEVRVRNAGPLSQFPGICLFSGHCIVNAVDAACEKF
jgi:hypothetical protein